MKEQELRGSAARRRDYCVKQGGRGKTKNRSQDESLSMLWEQERYHALGMAASPTVCSRNTNVIMVWAWMLWQPYALGTPTLSGFGHGRPYALGTGTLSWFGQGRIGNRVLLEHERYHALGMDALATVCSGNTNVIMLWAWMLWQPYALGTRTLSWFGHGRSGKRMLLLLAVP